jgi:hypothetical protein
MPEPAPPKPARQPLNRRDQRLLWLMVIAAWLALGAWASWGLARLLTFS